MINTVIAALAGTLIAAASPAPVAIPAPEPVAMPAQADPVAATPKKETRYCVIETVTGSRIKKTFCNTREGWLAEGFDPLEK